MKLIGSLSSPYVRKIRILLQEKQLPFDFVNDPPWEASTHISDYNPLGKVPALVSDTGEVFFDSPVIADFIETLGSHVPQIPENPLESVRLRQSEALADGIVDAGVVWLLETRRIPEKQDENVISRQRGKVERGLAMLEKHLKDREWVYGTAFSRADIAVCVCLLWLDFRLPAFDWRTAHPVLATYVARLEKRPSFAATIPVA